MLGNTPYADQMLKMIKSFDHLDGKDILKQKHLTDVEGWKLPPNLIPYRNFAAPNAKRPVLVTEFDEDITDWDKWYRWRGLPKESPAALLMHFPMSTYQLLVHCLDVTDPKLGRPEKRISLEVHIIGLEVELNFLPIFAELALLLPYHDIKLVGFGSGVEKLIEEAKRNRPTSLAANTNRNTPVFTYEAPDECGSSTIAIHLHGSSKVWPRPLSSDTPDAVVACNAGLGSYPEWTPVVQAAHELDIPFGVTEYTEQSLETQLSGFPRMLWGTSATPKRVEEYKIDLNPFQMPGQRGIPMYKLPNVVNGFTMVVNKKAKSPAELAARLDKLDLD
ncbi:hypothetical protein QCA50_004804 [Cerrena zonata]|uniref:Mitochondrial splicing suppressor 51-like C-terminal domain-containing protein n=1 Tax=Cerrena zonata TaxID=2478898 RepID=A0AAW0GQA7_9APHY